MEINVFKEPFTYYVIDNFIDESLAYKLSADFMDYNSPNWFVYDNPLEVKKSNNNWFYFPPTTYNYITHLLSNDFISSVENITGIKELKPDLGMHGSGWHIQGRGSKLNVHLDYNIHPKLFLQRKLNLIHYLTPDWDTEWGGNLEFWSHNFETGEPLEHISTVECRFNRAVIFDTTQNSWHGFAQKITCPENVYRKSIASYYLVDPPKNADARFRALYSASNEQKNSDEINDIIRKRSALQ